MRQEMVRARPARFAQICLLGWQDMSSEIVQAIEAIIRRGNDAEIRRRGDGYIVLEVKKTIKYTTQRMGAEESHRG